MIFKIQKSIYTSDGSANYLVYNESRDISFQSIDGTLETFFNKGELKVFVECNIKQMIKLKEEPNW